MILPKVKHFTTGRRTRDLGSSLCHPFVPWKPFTLLLDVPGEEPLKVTFKADVS